VLEIRLLGQPEFVYDGAPFRFNAPPRTLPLLAWLVLHRRAPALRDSVAFALWPDAAEEDARGDLRRHLYYLTKALPPENGEPWLRADRKTVAWNARAALSFDVADFERLVSAEGTLERATELYRGQLLEGLDEDWIEAERERLKTLAEHALLRLIERDAAHPERAIAHAQQLLRIDPWREDAIRALIDLRHRSGDRAGALREYRDFAARLRAELDVDPMPETKAAYDAVVSAARPLEGAGAQPATRASRRTTLPERVELLIGRATALDDVRKLRETARIVTLVGTGGVGKTRLALDVAWEELAAYPDGVWFADCAPLGDGTLVIGALAASTGLFQPTERPELAALAAALRRKKALLVIDNCEHVIAAVASAVSELVAACPDLSVLATSREPLAVRGERVYRVPSLDVPAAFEPLDAARARGFGAVALFEARAQAADPSFELNEANVAAVGDICRRLDGIALAIELAAARVTVLPPSELLGRLQERFRFLTGGERTALPRQRTMRATLDWSWALCSDSERVALGRVAVFSGGWTLEAAEAVCFEAPLERGDAVAVLGSLVAKSLVVADVDRRRYRLLESIRSYALEALEAAGEHGELARRHAEFFAGAGARLDAAYEETPDAEWYARATAELDNVRAALGWSLEGRGDTTLGAGLASAYATVWKYGSSRADRGWLDLAYERLDRAAHDALSVRLLWQIAAISQADGRHAEWVGVAVRDRGDARTRAEALVWIADVHRRDGAFEDAQSALDQAETLQSALERPKAHATLLRARGELAAARGDVRSARALFGRAIAIAESRGAIADVAATRVALARAAFAAGDLAGAIDAASQARDTLATTFGRGLAYADVTGDLAAYRIAEGDLRSARDDAREALEIARDLDFPQRVAPFVEHLAVIAALRGQSDRAAFLLGFSDIERRRRNLPRDAVASPGYERMQTLLAGALGERELQARLARGALAGIASATAEGLAVT
jgi:predicted ATPase/DNA-binding SARP family transcriptional activator